MVDSETIKTLQRIEHAKAECEKFAGAMDGVYEDECSVYRASLRRLGHSTSGLNDLNAARAVFRGLPGDKRAVKSRQERMAADSAAATDRAARFPNANRLRA